MSPLHKEGFTEQIFHGLLLTSGPFADSQKHDLAGLLQERSLTVSSRLGEIRQKLLQKIRNVYGSAGSFRSTHLQEDRTGCQWSHERYILPVDVSEEAFLGFIGDIENIVGKEHVVVNYAPEHQAEADYVIQAKVYVRTVNTLACLKLTAVF